MTDTEKTVVTDVDVSGTNEEAVLRAAKTLDVELTGPLATPDALLIVAAQIAKKFDVAVTITVHPALKDADDET